MRKLYFLLLLSFTFFAGQAQSLYEPFSYTPGANIGGSTSASGTTNNNWTTHSNSQTGTIAVISGSLTYTGLQASTGNRVNLPGNNGNTPRDVNRVAGLTGTPTVAYVSFLMNVIDDTQLNNSHGDNNYFISFGNTAGNAVSVLFGRVSIRSVNSDNNYRLGIQNNGGPGATYTDVATDLNFGTTYLVVVKYDFNGVSNDVATIWVNPLSLGGAEPAGGISNSSSNATTQTTFASIALRNSSATPDVDIDEIRVGDTWASVTPSGTAAPTLTVTPASLPPFTSIQGTASVAQTFTVNGNNLTANVVVTAPAHYEVSSNGTNYSASIPLPPVSGTITSAIVYVRQKANAAVGAPSGNITVATTGVTTQIVAVSGTVAAGVPAPFTPGNLTVLRVGNGVAALTSAAAPVYIDEFTPAGNLVQTIALPTTATGLNKALTVSGSAATEGLITRSIDKRYLMIVGYDAIVGTAAVNATTSAIVNRVVGRIAYNNSIDVTTSLTDFASAGNPRGIASTNGTSIWLTSSTDGIKYTTLGSTTSTQLSTTTTNLRGVNIFNGQLYVSAQSGTIRVAAVGTGLPTTPGQTITNVTGVAANPYGFFFVDLNPSVAGVDVLYVADDAGGFLKYSLVSGSWVANGSIASSGLRGIIGTINGSSVTFYATSASTLFSFTDASGYNGTITGTVNVLGAAGTNTAFRGIAFAPENALLPVRFSSLKATQKTNGIHLDWSNATEENVENYIIERSANGRTFSQLAKLAAKSNSGGRSDYNHIDAVPFNGDNFYRIKAIETTGKIMYTNIVRISTGKKGVELVVYPNPVTSTELGLQLSNLPAGNYTLRIINISGQIIGSRNFAHSGGSITESLELNNLINGLYTIEINGAVKLKKQFLKQ